MLSQSCSSKPPISQGWTKPKICDDELIPLQERIETVPDHSDLDEVYKTEQHLLYVGCTRARDNLLVTGVNPASEFLEDLG